MVAGDCSIALSPSSVITLVWMGSSTLPMSTRSAQEIPGPSGSFFLRSASSARNPNLMPELCLRRADYFGTASNEG
jgi:hypothetical protein